jgi:hypothetical protein
MTGSGIGSVPMSGIVGAIRDVLHAAAEKSFDFATKTVPLTDVAAAWASDTGAPRIVFTVGRNAG